MSTRWPRPLIEAGVAIVRDRAGRVLLAERQAFQLSPGFWELPGGKIEDGETPAQAAVRELREEVGLEALAVVPFAVHEHLFATRRIRLHLFLVTAWRGTAQGREGQRVAWVDPRAPEVGPILPSNLRVMAVLGLPRVVLSTRVGPRAMEAAIAIASHVAATGQAAVLVDEPELAPAPRRMLTRRLVGQVRGMGGVVLVRGDLQAAIQAGAAGAADPPDRLPGPTVRAPFLRFAICASSADVAAASAAGADALLIDASPEQAPGLLASAPPCPAFLRDPGGSAMATVTGRPIGIWAAFADLAPRGRSIPGGLRNGDSQHATA
ncbi:MAG: NUDIX domain-containing protein [Acetobacteraceae bacterium]|nr:NUDIX domain-containing protein [Acetobacteraceae bacterium]